MKNKSTEIPVIDIFAGPGGLSEGFHRYSWFRRDNELAFKVLLSIEKESSAHKTLLMRAFVRQFSKGKLPDAYYDYAKCDSGPEKAEALKKIKQMKEWETAEDEAWLAELGKVDSKELNSRIRGKLHGKKNWILLGGPPCQAYSIMGRSRRLGLGKDVDLEDIDAVEAITTARAKEFYSDERHLLYLEYLKIVALHQPSIFVMENVKGILSAKFEIPGSNQKELIFDTILQSLEDPWAFFDSEELPDSWEEFVPLIKHGYTLFSFVQKPDMLTADFLPADYLIKTEEYGVPQKRHRVIVLGVRNDLDIIPEQLSPYNAPNLSELIGDLPKLRSCRSGRLPDGRSFGDKTDTTERWLEAIRGEVSGKLLDEIAERKVSNLMKKVRNRKNCDLTNGGAFVSHDNNLSDRLGSLRRWLKDSKIKGTLQHETRGHMDSDFARYLFVSSYGQIIGGSPRLHHYPDSLIPNHESAKEKEGKKRGFIDRFKVQLADSPASTVTSHIQKDGHYFIHYDPFQCRSLTVREAARIQTFPDDYYFEGERTDRYGQVGNAVPPYLAVQLAEVVAKLIKEVEKIEGVVTTTA